MAADKAKAAKKEKPPVVPRAVEPFRYLSLIHI